MKQKHTKLNLSVKRSKMKIFKLTGVLFSNERGFEVKTEEFEILDQNDKKIIVKDSDFTTVWKDDTTYGHKVDEVKFDSSYEAFSIMKGVGYYTESKGFGAVDAIAVFAHQFETKIKGEIEERKNWLNTIKVVR